MFHSRNMENRIKGIHERTLRSVYDDSRNSSFEELLVKDKTASVYIKNKSPNSHYLNL